MFIPCDEKSLIKYLNDRILGKVYRETHHEQASEYSKRYRAEHKEELAQRKKEYVEAHSDEVKANRRKHYEANKDAIIAQQKAYKTEHKKEYADYFKRYNEAHKDEKRAYKKEYREKNKDKISAKQKQDYEANKASRLQKCADYYAQRKADGYSYRLDPETGKHTWVKKDTAPLRKPKLSIPDSEYRLIKYVQKTFTAKGIA